MNYIIFILLHRSAAENDQHLQIFVTGRAHSPGQPVNIRDCIYFTIFLRKKGGSSFTHHACVVLPQTQCIKQIPVPLSLSLSPIVSASVAKMSKGPGLFADIGKKAKDLLTKDYNSDQKLTVSTYSASGVALTSAAVKKGGLSTGDVAALYKYKNAIIDVKVDTTSNISTTLTFIDIFPSTKTIASFKVPDYNSGKLEVQYFHDHATLTTVFALNQSPIIDVSVAIGTPNFVVGGEAGYDTTSGSFTKYTAGLSVTKSDSSAAIIIGDKGDSITASYVHHLDNLKKSAAVGEITRKFSTNDNTFTVGGTYAVDRLTQVKARLTNHGKLGGLLQHEVLPKSVLTISGEIDTRALDKSPKFGLAIALKP